MSINLMKLIEDQLGGGLLRQVSGILGENEQVTQATVSQAIPALLGGMMKQASTDTGASGLASTLDTFDGSILDNLGGLLSGGNHKGLMDVGSGLLSGLFGGSLSSIVDAVSKSGGLGSTSTRSLLGLLAPIAMGVLGRQKTALGLDPAGLASMLMDQKDHLAGLLPSGIANVLGIGNLLTGASAAVSGAASSTARTATGAAGSATRAASDTVGSASRSVEAAGSRGSSMVTRLLPLLLILALGYFGYKKFIAGDGDMSMDTPDMKIETPDIKGEIDKASDAAKAMAGDLTGDLQGAIHNGTNALASVTDAASAKAAVPQLEKMNGSIGKIVNKLEGLPEPVRAQVQKMAGEVVPRFRDAAYAAMKIPGARSILEVHLKPILSQLEKLAG